MINKNNTIEYKKLSIRKVNKDCMDMFLLYLSERINWSKQYTILIKQFLIRSNIREPFLGFMIMDKTTIVGGILIIFQGFLKFNNKNIKVFNISNLFVDKAYRGIITISMISELSKSFKNSILTDYTPSEITSKILSKFKFSKSQSFSYRLIPFDLIKFRKFILNNKKPILDEEYFDKLSFQPSLFDFKKVKIRINNKNIIIGLAENFLIIKFLFLRIKIKKLRVISINKTEIFKENFFKIIFHLMIFHLSPLIYFDCLNYESDKSFLNKNAIKLHLIKKLNNFPNTIPPYTSEISISYL